MISIVFLCQNEYAFHVKLLFSSIVLIVVVYVWYIASAASLSSFFSCEERTLYVEFPMELPSLRGTLTKTGSGIPSNFMGVAMGKISFVSLTIALTMSLKADAGPNSVPPILSMISLETDFT